MSELVISDRPLKEFLKLFNKDEKLQIIELGDVGHPSSGYIDETYFSNINTVNDLLNIDYDFKGLVYLMVQVRGVTIEYHEGCYKISGDKKDIERLKFFVASYVWLTGEP